MPKIEKPSPKDRIAEALKPTKEMIEEVIDYEIRHINS